MRRQTPAAPAPASRTFGGFLILMGSLLNPWLLAWLLHVASPRPVYLLLIGLLDLGLIVGGGLLFLGRLRPRHLLFLGLIGCAMLPALEGGLRLFFLVRNRLAPPDRERTALGWRTVPDRHVRRDWPEYGTVDYRTVRGGFRLFDDPATTRTRLLVLGDSFTQGETVSAGLTYYERIAAARPNVAVFAYGCGGYGSLQESMILDQWADTIHPDLVLWQFCSNDLINNDLELESSSFINNNQMRRPYLVDGRVIYAFPFQDFGPLYLPVQHSVLLRLLDLRLSSLKTPGTSIESTLTADDPRHRRALAATADIMARVRKRAGPARIAAFSTDEVPWDPGAFRRICEQEAIVWLPGVREAIDAAKVEGRIVDGRAYDTHWNAEGHAIAADVLLRGLEDQKLLPPHRSETQPDPGRSGL